MTTRREWAIVIGALAGATVLALAFESAMHSGRAALVLYLPAVFMAATLAGPRAGLAATVLSPFVSELAKLHTHGTTRIVVAEGVALAVFAVVALWSTWFAARLGTARAEAERAADEARRRAADLDAAHQQAESLRQAALLRARDFTSLFEAAPIGIGIAEDPDCARITPNPAFAAMLGVDPRANISRSAPEKMGTFQLWTPDGRLLSPEELPMQRAAKFGEPVQHVEVDVLRDDGTRLALVEFATPLFDDHGKPRGAIGAFLDVTAQRRAAEAQRFLSDATNVLRGSLDPERTLSHLLRQAVPAMADLSVLDMVDARGHVVRVGLAHRDRAVETRILEALVQAPAGEGTRFKRGLLDVVGNGRSVLISKITPDALVAAGFSPQQVELAVDLGTRTGLIVPLVLDGEVIGAFSWARLDGRPRYDGQDLELAETVAQRATEAVQIGRLYRDAQAATQLRDEFVATISHELRTPLNALLGWIELARSGKLPPDKQQQALDAIERTARLQAQITNDLVDVSRAASGKFRLTPREVDVAEIVHASVDAFRLAAEAKGLTVTVAAESSLPKAFLDADRFQQIVFNLVANAVKFTPTGTVTVTARVFGGWLEVAVRDTGIGIDPRFLPYVFDRFRQADSSTTRTFGGLGLGLSIVRALVELHGGGVQAHSDGLGKGATFTAWLPVTPAAVALSVRGERHATAPSA